MLCNLSGMGNNLGLADIVRIARKNMGFNQADLGEAMGRDRTWVTQLERGKPVSYTHLTLPTILLV